MLQGRDERSRSLEQREINQRFDPVGNYMRATYLVEEIKLAIKGEHQG